MRDLAGGGFIAQQRNVVLVGGTGTRKTHLAMAIARSCIRAGSRPRGASGFASSRALERPPDNHLPTLEPDSRTMGAP